MLTQKRLREVLHYDPSTGIFTWIIATSDRLKVNTIAGSLRKSGYRNLQVDKKLYLAHRLAFLYMVGYIPKYVDHINGDPSDNSWENLRECSLKQNQYNRKRDVRSVTGVKGLTIRNNNKYYYANVITNRKHNSKYFPFTEEGKAEACEWLEQTRLRLHGDFSNHG